MYDKSFRGVRLQVEDLLSIVRLTTSAKATVVRRSFTAQGGSRKPLKPNDPNNSNDPNDWSVRVLF